MAEPQRQPHDGAPAFQLKHRLGLSLEVAGLDRDDMATELGAHKNTIGNYLRGDTRPSRSVMRVWALRCGVPFEWLSTGRIPDDNGGGGQVINASGWMQRRQARTTQAAHRAA